MTNLNCIPSFTRVCDFALCGQRCNVYLGKGEAYRVKRVKYEVTEGNLTTGGEHMYNVPMTCYGCTYLKPTRFY